MICIFIREGNIPLARQTTSGLKVSKDSISKLAQFDRLASAPQN